MRELEEPLGGPERGDEGLDRVCRSEHGLLGNDRGQELDEDLFLDWEGFLAGSSTIVTESPQAAS